MALTLENEFTVASPVDATWRALLDIEGVAGCLPGAVVQAGADGAFDGTMRVKLGAVTMSYKGTGRIVEVDEERRVAAFEVSGRETRGGGSASATITNALVGEGEHTRVRVRTELSVIGRPAQFGRGIMQDVAGAMLRDFAACLSERMAAPEPPPAAAAEPSGATQPPATPSGGPQPPPAPAPSGGPQPQPPPAPPAAPALDLTPALRSAARERIAPLALAAVAGFVVLRVLRRLVG